MSQQPGFKLIKTEQKPPSQNKFIQSF